MKTTKNKTWTDWPTSESMEWPFRDAELSFPMKRPREGKAKIDSMTDEELYKVIEEIKKFFRK